MVLAMEEWSTLESQKYHGGLTSNAHSPLLRSAIQGICKVCQWSLQLVLVRLVWIISVLRIIIAWSSEICWGSWSTWHVHVSCLSSFTAMILSYLVMGMLSTIASNLGFLPRKCYPIYVHYFNGYLIQHQIWISHFHNVHFGISPLILDYACRDPKIIGIVHQMGVAWSLPENDAPYFRYPADISNLLELFIKLVLPGYSQ